SFRSTATRRCAKTSSSQSRARPRSSSVQAMEHALAWLKQQQGAMERDLAELVEISSHTHDLDGVSKSAERFAAQLRALTADALSGGVVPSASGKYGAHVSVATRGDGAILLVG